MSKILQIQLRERPKGLPTEETFSFVEVPELPSLASGEVLLESVYISVDPYMRGRMTNMKSYIAPFEVGRPITGGVVAKVLDSTYDGLEPGDYVVGELAWQTRQIAKGKRMTKLNPNVAPVSTALGALGMPGLTAYFGLMDIGAPKAGETLVVSGAAGAVGTIVGQIGKLKGLRVVGIAGTDEKCSFLTDDLGFDAAINYKTETNLSKALASACPDGIDIYFDNVGGEVTDAVLQGINDFARLVICGQISLYNLEQSDVGPRPFPYLIIRKALARGFIVSDYHERFGEAMKELGAWIASGQVTYRETVVEGFDRIPDAFIGLFRGDNVGKLVVKVL